MKSYTTYFLLMLLLIGTAIDSWLLGDSIIGTGIALISLAALVILKMNTEAEKSKY